jgi:hypothetical protein
MKLRKCGRLAALVAVFCALPLVAAGEDLQTLLARIKAVGPEGKGHVAAAKAWRQLAGAGPEILLPTLTALNDANPSAANWLRSAVEAVVDRGLASGKTLPADRLEAFVRDTRHSGPARRLAYDCLLRIDKTASQRLIPKMLDDPGAELRRDAVALVIQEADLRFDKKDLPAAAIAYRKALAAARDRDQVEQIAKRLKDLKAPVDLTRHFGFITRWQLIGPFDNTAGQGFKKAFPPETRVGLAAPLEGKKTKQLRWVDHETTQAYGMVDLNTALGKHMGATAYAHAVVSSPKDQPVQLRAGSNNAVKLFLNGKQVFTREEYHHGIRMDQHVGTGLLKAGRNEILVKICQNEQTDSWAQLWSFQLRVCDAIGGPIPLKLELAPVKQSSKKKEQP